MFLPGPYMLWWPALRASHPLRTPEAEEPDNEIPHARDPVTTAAQIGAGYMAGVFAARVRRWTLSCVRRTTFPRSGASWTTSTWGTGMPLPS